MDPEKPVLDRMKELIAAWEAAEDRRYIFLSCYAMMTENMLAAVQAGDFEDVDWVARLLDNFAGYYFRALTAYDENHSMPPVVWQIAFEATHQPRIHVLQNLVLGVNAHITFDLVFALSEILSPEWMSLSENQRRMRYRDHCHVNDIIARTIDQVQDQVIERFEPGFRVVDTLLGPLDEWITSLMISDWRDEVWERATRMAEASVEVDRQELEKRVEEISIRRARSILGKDGLFGLADLI
jgi:hypothetical protein